MAIDLTDREAQPRPRHQSALSTTPMTPAQIRANLLQAIEGTAWTLESLSKRTT